MAFCMGSKCFISGLDLSLWNKETKSLWLLLCVWCVGAGLCVGVHATACVRGQRTIGWRSVFPSTFAGWLRFLSLLEDTSKKPIEGKWVYLGSNSPGHTVLHVMAGIIAGPWRQPVCCIGSPESDRKQEVGAGYKTLKIPPPPPQQQGSFSYRFNSLPARDQVFKDMSLWVTFHIQTTAYVSQGWPQVTMFAQQAPVPEPLPSS